MKKPPRPPLIATKSPFDGAITAKLENASYSMGSNRLMGVIVGSDDSRFQDGQFVVTAPLVEMLGQDLYRVLDGSVYIVQWIDEVTAMDVRLIEGAAIEEVRPTDLSTLWHFVWRDPTARTPYTEECWKWSANGPQEYWKRIDNGYINPRQAYAEGWRYGGIAVW